MDNLKKERIALEVIKTLKSKFDDFPEDATNNRNAPFHEAFLEAFKVKIEKYVTDVPIFVSLASWMHGLNTSLGLSFFEHAAHILCNGEKLEFKDLLINEEQQNSIDKIIAALKNNIQKPNLISENELLFRDIRNYSMSIPDFSADVYFEDIDKIVAIELKTVKPNSEIFKNEKDKILRAKAALKNKYPGKEIEYYLGFPFDPLNEEKCGFDKSRFFSYGIEFKKFFDPQEVLLADELWDFLSREDNTMQNILEIINSISKPDFMGKYEFIYEPKNIDIDKTNFRNILIEWHLNRDLVVVDNYDAIKNLLSQRKDIFRIFNQKLFNAAGKYNENRINKLLEAFNNYLS